MITDTSATRLGRAIAPLARDHPGSSGIHGLREGYDAFAARMLLARSAERTLDVQYYIWRKDLSGTLLLQAIREAADRGVRVRFLLDDNDTPGLDGLLAALDSHPRIEVRLFNPLWPRMPRLLGYALDPVRVNRRMHNKSFTADNQATIVGGRNVGDEYFDAAEGTLFSDLDVLAVGPAVDAVSRDFDLYWASDSSYPARRLLPPASAASLDAIATAAERVERDPAAAAFVAAVRSSNLMRQIDAHALPLEWATTRLVSDDPAKALGRALAETHLPALLHRALGVPASHVALVSPYFVPMAHGTDAFAAMARRGVKVDILTNAYEATDVAVVHAGYAKRRMTLLASGVRLFELRRTSVLTRSAHARSAGSSASSLHAKTFAVDGARVFVGSFNFDPRSARFNTEMGLVIESAALAGNIGGAFESAIPENAYEVRLSPDGARQSWIGRRQGREIRHETEPGTTFWTRAILQALSWLPIEPLL